MSLIDKSIILLFLGGLWSVPTPTTKIEMGGMELNYQKTKTGVRCAIAAPTTGWVAVGFNNRDDIISADLLQFNVQDGTVYGEDQYVQAAGKHPVDVSLPEGQNQIKNLEGREENGWTYISFELAWESADPFDFALRPQKPVWLILAYSNSDDFAHHSHLREHRSVIW
ncbi:MAG: DOMON domain-containing protein [Bacteroidota bacterium]